MDDLRSREAGAYTAAAPMEAAEFLRPEMAFLAENPEAFGLISDACPLATKHLLVAANGHSTEAGAGTPTYELTYPGVDGLLALYGHILPHTDETEDALQAAFGDNRTVTEHPISRYCAILAEVTALRVLRGAANGASYEQTRLMLDDEICHNLAALRLLLSAQETDVPLDDDQFEVSLGICRLREADAGEYIADIFTAGDFRVYILDEQGMAPMWRITTPKISPDSRDVLRGKSIRFRHPEPFAVLLLSDSVCSLSPSEHRGLKGHPGLIWRYRMRLEDYFMRLLTDCVREHEFGERATRFFLGRSHSWDSASGAMTVLRDGISYEVFRLRCQNRLSRLGHLIELLPNGYDTDKVPSQPTRSETELEFLTGRLERNPVLSDDLSDALRRCVLEKFARDDGAELCPPPADVPDYRRLTAAEIGEVFRTFDAESDGDRARIAENSAALRESISEHWITLRPVLMDRALTEDVKIAHARKADDRTYRACLEMNSRLSDVLAHRHAIVTRLQDLLSDSLDVLEAEGNDWICARAGAERADLWAGGLADTLPELLAELRTEWAEDTEQYRRLLAAYTAEREYLFRRDTDPAHGCFAASWQAILEGRLPEERWAQYREWLESTPKTAAFAPLLSTLQRISMGTGTLRSRIRARAAENRTARQLSHDPDLRIAALRGAAYEDADWGEAVVSVMDTATRNDFRATVRRWQETCELIAEQKAAFKAYSDMFHTYQ